MFVREFVGRLPLAVVDADVVRRIGEDESRRPGEREDDVNTIAVADFPGRNSRGRFFGFLRLGLEFRTLLFAAEFLFRLRKSPLSAYHLIE